jgi:hypothetical protein
VLGSARDEDNLHFYKDQCLDDALSYPRFQVLWIDSVQASTLRDRHCWRFVPVGFQNIPSGTFSDPVHSLASYEETVLVGSNNGVVKMLNAHGIANDEITIAPRQIAQYVPPGSKVRGIYCLFFIIFFSSAVKLNARFCNVMSSLNLWLLRESQWPIVTSKLSSFPGDIHSILTNATLSAH